MDSGELNFIGVQIKGAYANLSENIHIMQTCVNCSDCKSSDDKKSVQVIQIFGQFFIFLSNQASIN